MNKFCCLFLFTLITGCASKNSVLASTEPLNQTGHGFVAATFVVKVHNPRNGTGIRMPMLGASFHPVADIATTAFYLNTVSNGGAQGLWGDATAKLEVAGEYRVMTLVPVKAGRYQFGRMRATFSEPDRYLTLDNLNPPVFDVREGEVTYVGSLRLPTEFAINIVGQAIAMRSKLFVRDDFDLDMAGMKAVDSRLRTMVIHNGLKK